MATLRSKSGRPLTEEAIAQLTRKAEAGFEPDQLKPRRSEPSQFGVDAPSPRIEVRVSPKLYHAVAKRAHDEGITVSVLVRRLLDRYAEGG